MKRFASNRCGALALVALMALVPVEGRGGHLFLAQNRPTLDLNRDESPRVLPTKHPSIICKDDQLLIRGGARKEKDSPCDDTDSVILAKTAMVVVMQAAGLLGVMLLAVAVSPSTGDVAEKIGLARSYLGGPPIPQDIAIFIWAFRSDFIEWLIDGSMSAATNQRSRPTVTPSPGWYSALKKPWWNPPGWLFPIMWLIISKPTQFLAVRKVLTVGQEEGASIPWGIFVPYCIHLALGDAWNNVFFGCQRAKAGLKVIVSIYVMITSSAYLFYQYNPTAGLFLLPTCGWLTVATALNASIYMLNKPPAAKK